MKLVILFGPPSVGKTTVGQLIESETDYKLFHNHMIMDGVMHIFGVSSHAENRLSKLIRSQIITEAAENNINLLFTYVWDFAQDKGKQNIDMYKQIYESHGGDVLFVELSAPLSERIKRAANPERLRMKPHAPDSKRVADLDKILDYGSPQPFYYPDSYVHIDTADKTPSEIAREIIDML